jgi:hypothetical protein
MLAEGAPRLGHIAQRQSRGLRQGPPNRSLLSFWGMYRLLLLRPVWI